MKPRAYQWLSILLALSMVLGVAVLRAAPTTFFAAGHAATGTEYLDENNQTQYVTADITTITENMKDLGADSTKSWYVVNDEVTISNRVEITGDVNLILTDSSKLTASAGIHVPAETASLTIYGQKEQSGAVTATGSGSQAGSGGGGGNGSYIEIFDGRVTAIGGHGGAGIGGGGSGGGGDGSYITISGGTVTAIGSRDGAASGNGDYGGAGIGGGMNGPTVSGSPTISGGVTTASGDRAAIDSTPAFGNFIYLTYGNTENAASTIVVESTDNPQSDWSIWKWVKIQPGSSPEPPTESFTVIFDANGGTVSPTSGATGAGGKLSGLPASPTRDGYEFDGWFTAAEGGEQVTADL